MKEGCLIAPQIIKGRPGGSGLSDFKLRDQATAPVTLGDF